VETPEQPVILEMLELQEIQDQMVMGDLVVLVETEVRVALVETNLWALVTLMDQVALVEQQEMAVLPEILVLQDRLLVVALAETEVLVLGRVELEEWMPVVLSLTVLRSFLEVEVEVEVALDLLTLEIQAMRELMVT
jgi:hypothetical protein